MDIWFEEHQPKWTGALYATFFVYVSFLPVDQRHWIVTVPPNQRDPPILVNTPRLCRLISSFSELEEAFVCSCLVFFDYVRGPCENPFRKSGGKKHRIYTFSELGLFIPVILSIFRGRETCR